MALFNVSVWQRSRFTLQWFIINLVGSLACLTAVALAQFEWSEAVSGSVSIPDVAFTCLGNLAVFMTAFTRGRLDMENGARDVLATTRGPKLNAINGCGLTTRPPNDLKHGVDVVMLSKYNERPHSSLTQFMRYISHSHALESILLQFSPFTAALVAEGVVCTRHSGWVCQCIVLSATEEIMIMLAHRLPRTLKRLSENQYLLPSPGCLNNGCHGCNQGLLYVEELPDVEAAGGTSESILRVGNPGEHSPAAAVCEALDEFLIEEENSCICIPVHQGNADRWTNFMIKFLKSKEKEAKGIRVVVSDALQHYITRSAQELGFFFRTPTGCIFASEIYESASLILPRVAEVIVNIVLVGWLRVDGFSSSLVARRAIRDHVVDSAGTGFSANAFLTRAAVFCSADGTNVCQVLCFRGGILSARRVSYMVGFVNVICCFAWSALLTVERYWAPAAPLSTPRVYVIIGAVGVALGMDCFEVLGGQFWALDWARARARAREWARAEVQAAGALAEARAREGPGAGAGFRALAVALAEAGARELAGVRALRWVRAEARNWAEARDRAEAREWAEARARAREWAEARARAREWAEARALFGAMFHVLHAWALTGARFGAMFHVLHGWSLHAWSLTRATCTLVQFRFQDQVWARAQLWWLLAVVTMEVGCIACLVVWLHTMKALEGGVYGVMHMKKGEERGVYGDLQSRMVYSVMPAIVWVKWGIGSFLLGDNATEDEHGSPYLFRTRNRRKWVYCSAFLLNAMLAGVRHKWKYSI